MQRKQAAEVVAAPGFGKAAGRHPRQSEETCPPSRQGWKLPKGPAAAAEQGCVHQLQADQGGKQHHIGQADFGAAQPALPGGDAPLQLLLQRLQGAEQLRLGLVVGGLVPRETAAVHAVVHAALQSFPPALDHLPLSCGPQIGPSSGPVVEQLNQPRALVHQDAALAAGIQRRHRGRSARSAAAGPVELRQGGAAGKGGGEAPAAGGRVWLHHQQIDAAR